MMFVSCRPSPSDSPPIQQMKNIVIDDGNVRKTSQKPACEHLCVCVCVCACAATSIRHVVSILMYIILTSSITELKQ